MAVKHATGFLPPTLKIPMDVNPNRNVPHLLDVVRRKYGLNTTALRQLVALREYHCVELELQGKPARQMEAIWVGLQDYVRMRGKADLKSDPLAQWLREKKKGSVPATRPPWEQAGWYKKAVGWVHFQLDRLNIQATGTVSQVSAFRRRSSLLSVPTSAGKLFFKATFIRDPLETPLTVALARQWPDNIPQVLASDDKKNWMLMRDAGGGKRHVVTADQRVAAASQMARLQVESAENLAEWAALGCETTGLSQLSAFLERPDLLDLISRFDTRGQDLTEEERNGLVETAPRLVEMCDRLSGYRIPETLVHPDFWSGNIIVDNDSVRFIDWSNSAISHPFFSLPRLVLLARDSKDADPVSNPMVSAYLEPFRAFEAQDRLEEAYALARRLEPAWRLLCWAEERKYVEPGSIASVVSQRFFYKLARQLVEMNR